MSHNLIAPQEQKENKFWSRANPAFDAFGRARVGLPETLFDSKLNVASHPLFWDDQEVSGSGTSSVYSKAQATYTMSVSADTAGKRVRQSKTRTNYQPGKSQSGAISVRLGTPRAGVTRRVGHFDDNNGVFLQLSGSTLALGVRSSVSGSPVDTIITQDNWELHKMNGEGSLRVNLDTEKVIIFAFDFESLQVGTVRCAFYIDGIEFYVHAFHHANLIDVPYFSTPNLPVRYEIENDGSGAAADMLAICSTIISEGGSEETGISSYISTRGTSIAANAAGTAYAVLGIRLKATALDNVVKIAKVSMSCLTNDRFEWALVLNPTVAGTFTYNDRDNSALQFAVGATANTVTGGVELDGSHSETSSAVSEVVESLYYLGSTIAGVPDEIVLVGIPESNNATLKGSITAKEIA